MFDFTLTITMFHLLTKRLSEILRKGITHFLLFIYYVPIETNYKHLSQKKKKRKKKKTEKKIKMNHTVLNT